RCMFHRFRRRLCTQRSPRARAARRTWSSAGSCLPRCCGCRVACAARARWRLPWRVRVHSDQLPCDRVIMRAKIRKIVVQIDETRMEMGREVAPPTRRALAMAVIENPYAGRYALDLSDLVDIGEELGGL